MVLGSLLKPEHHPEYKNINMSLLFLNYLLYSLYINSFFYVPFSSVLWFAIQTLSFFSPLQRFMAFLSTLVYYYRFWPKPLLFYFLTFSPKGLISIECYSFLYTYKSSHS